jgi:mannitol-1-phosphate 5-dehydrogenase
MGAVMGKIVIFGAGNIGRSLVGQLFSRAGYEVVFVDVVEKIVDALNSEGRYRIDIRDIHAETIWVENVRAVQSEDTDKVAREVAATDLVAISVGVNNLRYIYRNIARGLVERLRTNRSPINVIICENVRDASKQFREGLSKHLPADYPQDSMIGLVETSIGKMVPIMTEEQKRVDPLLIYAEAYNKIILDRKAFKGELPKVKGLEPKDNMAAYVDRKLFIHNLGHAVTAYLGYITDPRMVYVWEAIGNQHIREAVEGAMWESGRALAIEHIHEFNEEKIKEYIDDLVRRFSNRALGDTIYRVGRDLPRKLSRNERLIGALSLDKKHSVFAPFTALGVAAAMFFRGKDNEGNLYRQDRFFAEEVYPRGIDYIIEEVCGLDSAKEKDIIKQIKKAYTELIKTPRNWFSKLDAIVQQELP